MFPPKKGIRGQRQVKPRAMRAYRAPDSLDDWIEKEVAEQSLNRSGFVVQLLEFARDVRVALGDDWFELLRQAGVDRVSPGEVAARAIKQGLKGKR